MYVFTYTCGCTETYACACGSQKPMLCVFFIDTLYFFIYKHCLLLKLTIQLGSLSRELYRSVSTTSTVVWSVHIAMSDFCVCAGNLNSGLRACRASISVTKPYVQLWAMCFLFVCFYVFNLEIRLFLNIIYITFFLLFYRVKHVGTPKILLLVEVKIIQNEANDHYILCFPASFSFLKAVVKLHWLSDVRNS